MEASWDARVDEVWADDALGDAERIVLIDALAAELDPADPRGAFERAGARDSAGIETEAEPLYREALALGLDPSRRPRAVIQLASTLRNLGRIDESLEMLRDAHENDTGSSLRDATAAFYALALASDGEALRAASIALTTLAPHLPRYTRSVSAYATELLDTPE